MAVQSNGRANAITYSNGSHGRVQDCQINGAQTRCLYVTVASLVYAIDNTGGGSTQGYNATSSAIFVKTGRSRLRGTCKRAADRFSGRPARTRRDAAARVDEGNEDLGAERVADVAPGMGLADRQRRDVPRGIRGSPAVCRAGCAFYGTKLQVAGKTADAGKVYIRRLSSGGASSAQTIYLATHSAGSQPGGDAEHRRRSGRRRLARMGTREVVHDPESLGYETLERDRERALALSRLRVSVRDLRRAE